MTSVMVLSRTFNKNGSREERFIVAVVSEAPGGFIAETRMKKSMVQEYLAEKSSQPCGIQEAETSRGIAWQHRTFKVTLTSHPCLPARPCLGLHSKIISKKTREVAQSSEYC